MNDFDELWPGGPRFLQSDGFKLGTDSVLLAHFANKPRARHAVDLGSGAGVLAVLLAFSNPGLKMDGIEINPSAAGVGRENLRINGLADRVNIITGDLRDRSLLRGGAYDLVVSNPPYFPAFGGKTSPDPARAAQRDERFCTLNELVAAARRLCRWGGSFCLVHRPERLAEVFCAMSGAEIEPKRLRLVSARAEGPPSLALIEGRRGGKPGLKIEPPLVIYAANGEESDELKVIYRRSGAVGERASAPPS